MERTLSILAGAGLGAGLMYLLDPQMGGRRRSTMRDTAMSMAHQAQDAAGSMAHQMQGQARSLASGDFSRVVGSKDEWWTGHWSSGSRGLMGLLGGGLFLYGLTQQAPTACVLGSIGLGLAAESVFNCSVEEIVHAPETVREMASHMPEDLGFTHASQRTDQLMHQATAAVGG